MDGAVLVIAQFKRGQRIGTTLNTRQFGVLQWRAECFALTLYVQKNKPFRWRKEPGETRTTVYNKKENFSSWFEGTASNFFLGIAMDYIYFLVYCTISVLFLDYRHAAYAHGKLIFSLWSQTRSSWQGIIAVCSFNAFVHCWIAPNPLLSFFLLCKKIENGTHECFSIYPHMHLVKSRRDFGRCWKLLWSPLICGVPWLMSVFTHNDFINKTHAEFHIKQYIK